MKTPESKLRAIKKYNQVTIKSYALKLNRNTEADLISHLESKSGFSKYVKSLIRKDMEESKKVELDSCDKASYTCQHEIGKGLLNMENRKPIGVYAISNTMGISVYDIDYYEDTVLVGYWQNDQEIFENCKIETILRNLSQVFFSESCLYHFHKF